MREIKFRAWNPTSQAMFWSGKCNSLEKFFSYTERLTQEMPLMQYTGLKDKSGKEIYEGDIILYPDTYTETVDVGVSVGLKVAETPENSFATVVFFGGAFCLDCSGGETLGKGKHTFDWVYNWYGMEVDELEVIGNIYEDPELLGSNSTDARH